MPKTRIVYLVDDDSALVEALVHFMAPLEAKILAFGSAEKFLAHYQPTGPACLVLDIKLPGMGGLELLKLFSQRKIQIPTIVLTGHGDVKTAVSAMRNGAIQFFEKPFSSFSLMEEVKIALSNDERKWTCRTVDMLVKQKLSALKKGELDVMLRVVKGKTNVQIAAELGLSVRGVEARRSKAYAKLSVKSRTQLLQFLNLDALMIDSDSLCPAANI